MFLVIFFLNLDNCKVWRMGAKSDEMLLKVQLKHPFSDFQVYFWLPSRTKTWLCVDALLFVAREFLATNIHNKIF